MKHTKRICSIFSGFISLVGVPSVSAESNRYRETFDQIFMIQLVLSVIILLGVIILGILLLRKYTANQKISPKEVKGLHNLKLEIAWTLVATLIVIYLFAISMGPTEDFASANNRTGDVTIIVTAQRFSWNFEFEGVANSSFNSYNTSSGQLNPLVLYNNQSYILKVTALEGDVIHSFFVPELGFKVDAVPGHFNYVFLDDLPVGNYSVTCAEFCGAGHYNMPALIMVLEG